MRAISNEIWKQLPEDEDTVCKQTPRWWVILLWVLLTFTAPAWAQTNSVTSLAIDPATASDLMWYNTATGQTNLWILSDDPSPFEGFLLTDRTGESEQPPISTATLSRILSGTTRAPVKPQRGS